LSDPLIATAVAFVAVTVRVEELPSITVLGSAEIVTVGAGFRETVTVAAALTVPPGPVAVAVYVVLEVGLTDCTPPLDASVKVDPSLPETVTCVAFTAVTVRVEDWPEVMAVGFALIWTVGAGFGVTVTTAVAVAFPPAPVAVAV
jgi:hypothetical protein